MQAIVKWVLVVLGVLFILVVLAYAEEDLRGWHAWQKCKREFEAKGFVLDWNKFVPPPVPDDQNFFKAPKMQEWFVKPISRQPTNDFVIRLSNANTTVAITNEIAAINYLAWSDQFKSDFDMIRDALQRPYARMDGNYSDPAMIPIPNYLAIRALSQTLSQRTKCYLLLRQPEKALGELILLNDSRRLLEAAPSGKPMSMVAAMLNVAVVGVYVDTIADGTKSHTWQESQLAALQKQLGLINLPPFLADGVCEENAFLCYEIQNHASKLRPRFETGLARGWEYQNMVTVVRWNEQEIGSIDHTNSLVSPDKIDEAEVEKSAIKHFRPYTFMAAIMVPNYSRAFQSLAYNQTLADEAQIACALERYRLAYGAYPETLDALIPQYIAKLPHDIIGSPPSQGSGAASQPLHYRRTADGKFLLYSIGWNETDDGGQVALKEDGSVDLEKGDWVWKN